MAVTLAIRRPAGAALAVVALLGLVACREGDQDTARTVAGRFHAAVEAGRGAEACRQLAEPAVEELEKSERKPCSRAVLALDLDPGRPIAARVFETNASVDLTGGQTAFLERRDEGWRISAAGCRPQLEQPYDCKLEV